MLLISSHGLRKYYKLIKSLFSYTNLKEIGFSSSFVELIEALLKNCWCTNTIFQVRKWNTPRRLNLCLSFCHSLRCFVLHDVSRSEYRRTTYVTIRLYNQLTQITLYIFRKNVKSVIKRLDTMHYFQIFELNFNIIKYKTPSIGTLKEIHLAT